MRLGPLLIVVAGLVLLGGCSAPGPANDGVAPSPPAKETVEPDAGASTIEEVWGRIGCAENDPLGTRGSISATDKADGPARSATCVPLEDGQLAFFYELRSAEEAASWVATGGLEVGSTDAVFIDGAVVILATDAATAAEFAEMFAASD